jgi:hypothetical protein
MLGIPLQNAAKELDLELRLLPGSLGDIVAPSR